MKTETLVEFLTLKETLNFRKAAERLYISQPTLSSHIAELEQELGVKLFNRDTRSVALTQEGMFLAAQAERMIDIAKETYAGINCRKTAALRIAVPFAYQVYQSFIPGVYRDMKKIHPNVRCDYVDSGKAADVFESLSGGCDLAFCAAHEDYNRGYYTCVEICNMKAVVLVAKDSTLAEKPTVSVSDLKKLVFRSIDPEPTGRYTQTIVAALRRQGFTPMFGEPIDNFFNLDVDEYSIICGNCKSPISMQQETTVAVPLSKDIIVPMGAVYDARNVSEELLDYIKLCKKHASKG